MPVIKTRDAGWVIDMHQLAATGRAIIAKGHPFWMDDLLDKPENGSPLLRGTTLHTPAGLATAGARPSAIKLSYGLLRGLSPESSPAEREMSLSVLDRAAVLSTVNNALTDPFGRPLITVLEGMSSVETVRRAREHLDGTGAEGVFYGQGTCVGAMAVEIGDDHRALGPQSLNAPGGLLQVDRKLGFASSRSVGFGLEFSVN